MMGYKLGKKSKAELQRVHPILIDIVECSLQSSLVDFSVHDGLRSPNEQNSLFKRGVSTLDGYNKISQHQLQDTGYGHAVDLVPYINGKLRWEWKPIFSIALAVQVASEVIGANVRWGGCWKIITNSELSPEKMHYEYLKRKALQGKKPFADGPHFELIL
jgi:peptidoglycan L-alanyl-D-glutamate endopeptidase CwlK